MSDNQLETIRRYCDTSDYRLRGYEKDLLCKVLENPSKYNGFESKLDQKEDSGRDYRSTWESRTERQYRILIDSHLRIKERYRFSCDDGYVDDDHWCWSSALEITDTRKIIDILQRIESEL